MTNPSNYDPGPGQPFGLSNRQDKDGGDGAERFNDVGQVGGDEEPAPKDIAAKYRDSEPAESD